LTHSEQFAGTHRLLRAKYGRDRLALYSEWKCASDMRVKISITLSSDLLDAVDKRSSQLKNRSNFIEAAIRAYIAKIVLDEQNARDLAIINREAKRLNKQAADVLAYQVMGHD